MNLNLSASLNISRLIFKPSLCLPHHTVPTFNDLPIPLEKGLRKDGRKVEIKAVVLDKDDCFAYPDAIEVYGSYKVCINSEYIIKLLERLLIVLAGSLQEAKRDLPRSQALGSL